MILDKHTLLSDRQAITTSTVSTNVYDLQQARDVGPGDTLELMLRVTTSFAGGTSLAFAVVTSANADLSAPNVLVTTPAIPVADLIAGSEWLRITVPAASKATQVQRYLGVSYTASGTFSAGAVTAALTADRDAQGNYASGLNVGGF